MRRERHLFLPPIVLDRTSRVSLSRQICAQISDALRDKSAADHLRLPSTRVLAKLLCVSRNTVLAAYEELIADGLIAGHRGAATIVQARERTDAPVQIKMDRVLREAAFPARTLPIEDRDGNTLYIRF